MAILTYSVFFLALAALLAGAGAAFGYARGNRETVLLRFGWRVTLAGAVLLAVTLCLRAAHLGQLPLSNAADVLNVFLFLSTITALIVSGAEARRALLVFYLPVLAVMALVVAYLAVVAWGEPPGKALESIPLLAHVGMVFLAYALFFIASLTSAAYAYQARRLKDRATSGLLRGLPSLEHLDATLFQLIRIGYPIFVVTLLLGLYWTHLQRELLAHDWWRSPKVAVSVVMVVFYAASYHARSLGWLRGPKLAHFVFVGFAILLGLSLVLRLLGLSDVGFYGDS